MWPTFSYAAVHADVKRSHPVHRCAFVSVWANVCHLTATLNPRKRTELMLHPLLHLCLQEQVFVVAIIPPVFCCFGFFFACGKQLIYLLLPGGAEHRGLTTNCRRYSSSQPSKELPITYDGARYGTGALMQIHSWVHIWAGNCNLAQMATKTIKYALNFKVLFEGKMEKKKKFSTSTCCRDLHASSHFGPNMHCF